MLVGDGTFCARREIMGLAERGSCKDTASGIEKAILMGRQARLYPFHWQNVYVWLLSLGRGGGRQAPPESWRERMEYWGHRLTPGGFL